ncbi:MAG: type II/IV secretion system protein [Planctomycetaceae bacterium]|jgi:general secretion pathway protein E|nr:type II/IV secretion system protein [Planctomycetaceae bacterium]MBT6156650.1 type II/IV secretion system protein [Planctomycetaceae bacterium]MBT6486402.1 type II/IV secretion system protein [Planctomycetaceae bacterium]MBT6496225.1 type II/IV secretion system protein [Planctomycetaceae bacterium]
MRILFRDILRIIAFVCVVIIAAQSVSAQDESDDGEGEDGERPAATRSTDVDSEEAFPRDPSGSFFRGNDRSIVGFYLNLLRFVPVVLLFVLWMWSSHWVDEDSRSLQVRSQFWNTAVLACGTVGFLAVFCLPMFLMGSVVLLAAYGAPLGFYIVERNARVPDSSKVMTPEHLRKVGLRVLAKLGMGTVSKEVQAAGIGPNIKFIGKSGTGRGNEPDRSAQVEKSPGFLAAKELVYDAIQRRGTDIHLEPNEDELSIRLRIDGVMHPTEPFDRAVGNALVNIFKVLAAMDITERRRPQDGSFRALADGRPIDFRAATQGTRHGEKMSLRILDQSNSVSSLDQLGLRKQLLASLRDVVHLPHGLFLSCGPTGAGKSTTLYASLSDLDSMQQNIITIEDPVEYKMEGVNQIEINTKAGQSFAKSLRSILRQDPDVVMIGEIRDAETGEIACQAANTGHMVFSTIHANDTITALYRLLELGIEPFMISNSISAIMGQRLVRRLCPDCRTAYRPSEELLKKLHLPPGKVEKFYRTPKKSESQCPTCEGVGFRGRMGVYELLVINDEIRELIRDKGSATQIKKLARRNGMLSMKEEGLRLVIRGMTSIEELQRVVK